MSKILVVFGATGQQGGSLIRYVLRDTVLSKQYRIRAVTRDPSTPAAQKLKAQGGVEVVPGDANDRESLKRVMQGANTAFIMTLPDFNAENAKAVEIAQGKAMGDAAVAAGLEHIIFSTLPHVAKISENKYQHADHFDAKAEVENYLRGLAIKTTFYAPGWFMQNFIRHMGPQKMDDGTYAIISTVTPETELPLLDVDTDTGKFVGPALADPAEFDGKTLYAAEKCYSYATVARMMAESSGKIITYKQMPGNPFAQFLTPVFAKRLLSMMCFVEEYGYYGPHSEDLVRETVKTAAGELTSFEEYLHRNATELKQLLAAVN